MVRHTEAARRLRSIGCKNSALRALQVRASKNHGTGHPRHFISWAGIASANNSFARNNARRSSARIPKIRAEIAARVRKIFMEGV